MVVAVALDATGFSPGAGAHTQQATVKDGVYSAAQAERAKPTFVKACAGCHRLNGIVSSQQSTKGPALSDEAFLVKWDGKTLHELVVVMKTTMPNDGSMVLSDSMTADIAAALLRANGFPPGNADFKDEPGREILIVK